MRLILDSNVVTTDVKLAKNLPSYPIVTLDSL